MPKRINGGEKVILCRRFRETGTRVEAEKNLVGSSEIVTRSKVHRRAW